MANRPDDLLDRLIDSRWWKPELWAELFEPGNLWCSLQSRVATRNLHKNAAGRFLSLFDWYKSAGIEDTQTNQKRAALAAWITTAALDASGTPPSTKMPDGVVPGLTYRDCVSGFDASLSCGTMARVPVATAAMKGIAPGILWLELEAIRGGGGLVRHPRDLVGLYLARLPEDDSDASSLRPQGEVSTFARSMADAFAIAQAAAGVSVCRGRWSFAHPGGSPVKVDEEDISLNEAAGRSASGAALLGWYRCLTNSIYDERVIVIAEVEQSGKLKMVGNDALREKIDAILKANDTGKMQVDTIGVVEENFDEAESAIREERRGEIRVKKLKKEIVQPAGAADALRENP